MPIFPLTCAPAAYLGHDLAPARAASVFSPLFVLLTLVSTASRHGIFLLRLHTCGTALHSRACLKACGERRLWAQKKKIYHHFICCAAVARERIRQDVRKKGCVCCILCSLLCTLFGWAEGRMKYPLRLCEGRLVVPGLV